MPHAGTAASILQARWSTHPIRIEKTAARTHPALSQVLRRLGHPTCRRCSCHDMSDHCRYDHILHHGKRTTLSRKVHASERKPHLAMQLLVFTRITGPCQQKSQIPPWILRSCNQDTSSFDTPQISSLSGIWPCRSLLQIAIAASLCLYVRVNAHGQGPIQLKPISCPPR